MSEVSSFTRYRQLYEEQHEHAKGVEAVGIFDASTHALALEHPDTLTVEHEGTTQPFAIPASIPGYFNLPYFQKLPGATRDNPVYWLTMPDSEAFGPQHASLFQTLAQRNAILTFDYPIDSNTTSETDTDNKGGVIAYALGAAGLRFSDVRLDDMHYHYASKAEPPHRAIDQAQSAIDALCAPDVMSDIQIETTFSDTDVATTWEFYEKAHEKIGTNDPIQAGFSRDDLQEILQNPAFLKSVYRLGSAIVNICLIADVRTCSWVNQDFFVENYPEEYERGQILFSPGVVTNSASARSALNSLQTMGRYGQGIAQAGLAPVFAFACNEQSNRNVPGLSERSLQRAGLDITFPLVSRQRFRALLLGA